MGRRDRAWTIAVVAALCLAACGSDADEGTATDETVADTTVTDTAAVATDPPATDPVDTQPADTEPADTEPTDSPTTDAPATGGSYDDPCELLAGVDLDAVLGEPAGTPEGELNDIADMCTVESTSEGTRGSLVLSVSTNSAADNFVNLEELFGVDAEITGLGDQAFHSGPYVIVLAGDTLVNFQAIRDASIGFAVPDPDAEAAVAQILTNLAG